MIAGFWFSLAAAWARTVAVLPFDPGSKSEAYDGLGRALAGMVVSDLSRAEGIELVERDRLDALLSEIELGEGGFVDPATAAKLGKGLGAEWMVMGTFTVLGERFLLDGRAVDVGSGKVVAAVDAQGTVADFVSVEKELVEELLGGLQVALSASARRQMLGDAPTEDFQAVASYGAGLQAEFEGRLEEARKKFEEAAQRDPAFDLPAQRITALRAELERQEAERQSKRVDEKTARLRAALASTPTEMDQKGPTRTDEERARYALRFMLLRFTGQRCQGAQEMAHYLDRHQGKLVGGAHPGPYNALHLQAHALGLYVEKPKPWDRGTVMPPNEPFEDYVNEAPTVSWVGGFVVGTVDGPDRAADIGESLLNEAIACAGNDPGAQVRAIEGVAAQVKRLGIGGITTWSNGGRPIEVEVELMRLAALAARDGMTADVEAGVAKLLARELPPDDAYSVRARLAQIARVAEGRARRERVLMGWSPSRVLAFHRAWAAGDASAFAADPACRVFLEERAVAVAKDQLGRMTERWSGEGEPSARDVHTMLAAAEAAAVPRLMGCVPGEPGVMRTLPEALAWLQTAEARAVGGRDEAACTAALKTARESTAHYGTFPEQVPGLYGSIVVGVAFRMLVAPGCVALR